jgi:hypothetical protein
VDLITEFPPEPEPIVEQGVVVGPPAFLCDPAVRSIVHDPVGGLAELPAIAGDDGGWSTWAYAALAGGLAAVIAAVTAGAWFARRRWVR